MVCKKPKVAIDWVPLPVFDPGQGAHRGLCISWALDGTALCIKDEWQNMDDGTLPLQRVCLLP